MADVTLQSVFSFFILSGFFVLAPFKLFAVESYSVNPGSTVTINEHGICQRVTNNNASLRLWVPTKSSAEWNSFQNKKPSIAALANCRSCKLPWGGSIAHGASATAYSTNLPTGPCSSVSQTRTCNDGTLSGSYTYGNCTNGCPAATVSGCALKAPAHDQSGGSCATGYMGSCSYKCDAGSNVMVSNNCTPCTAEDNSTNMCPGNMFSSNGDIRAVRAFLRFESSEYCASGSATVLECAGSLPSFHS